MKIIFSLVFFVLAASAEVHNNRAHYKTLPITYSGEVEKSEIQVLAKALFKKFTGLEEKLGVICTNDARLTDARHKWYCQITPWEAELHENGMVTPYAPDENTWTMRIDMQANTYELKKDWQQLSPTKN